jgi:hypothetical protein
MDGGWKLDVIMTRADALLKSLEEGVEREGI